MEMGVGKVLLVEMGPGPQSLDSQDKDQKGVKAGSKKGKTGGPGKPKEARLVLWAAKTSMGGPNMRVWGAAKDMMEILGPWRAVIIWTAVTAVWSDGRWYLLNRLCFAVLERKIPLVGKPLLR